MDVNIHANIDCQTKNKNEEEEVESEKKDNTRHVCRLFFFFLSFYQNRFELLFELQETFQNRWNDFHQKHLLSFILLFALFVYFIFCFFLSIEFQQKFVLTSILCSLQLHRMTMTANDKRMAEREALRSVIQQWNANRLDLFELSEPDEVI